MTLSVSCAAISERLEEELLHFISPYLTLHLAPSIVFVVPFHPIEYANWCFRIVKHLQNVYRKTAGEAETAEETMWSKSSVWMQNVQVSISCAVSTCSSKHLFLEYGT